MSAPFGTSFAWPGLQRVRNGPGSVAGQEVAAESAAAAATFTGLGLFGNERHADGRILHPRRVGIANERDDVMRVLAVRGPGFGELHVLVFGEIGRQPDILIIDSARRRNIKRSRDLKHHVRLADRPAFGEGQSLRRVLGIAGLGAAIHPSHQRLHFGVRQPAVIRKFSVMRIGEPRRHLLSEHRCFDRLRVRPRALIVEQRHRGSFAGPVAALAVFLENGENVLIERRLRDRRRENRIAAHIKLSEKTRISNLQLLHYTMICAEFVPCVLRGPKRLKMGVWAQNNGSHALNSVNE